MNVYVAKFEYEAEFCFTDGSHLMWLRQPSEYSRTPWVAKLISDWSVDLGEGDFRMMKVPKTNQTLFVVPGRWTKKITIFWTDGL